MTTLWKNGTLKVCGLVISILAFLFQLTSIVTPGWVIMQINVGGQDPPSQSQPQNPSDEYGRLPSFGVADKISDNDLNEGQGWDQVEPIHEEHQREDPMPSYDNVPQAVTMSCGLWYMVACIDDGSSKTSMCVSMNYFDAMAYSDKFSGGSNMGAVTPNASK